MLRAYGALLRAEPAAALELVPGAPDPGRDADGRPYDGLHALRTALGGAASFDLDDRGAGLRRLGAARAAAAGRPGPPEIVATIAALEHGAATSHGRSDLARTALSWAEAVLGPTGEVLLMRARRHVASGRHRAVVEALRPLWQGTAVVLPWTPVEARVLQCLCALRADRRRDARQELEHALAAADAVDVLRPLAFGPPAVVDLLTRHVGSFGDREPAAGRVLDARRRVSTTSSTRLTDRERDVLSLLPTLWSLGEIATELTVSHRPSRPTSRRSTRSSTSARGARRW